MLRDAHLVATGHRHAVVQHQAGADVRPLPGVVQRVEERHRPDQVRREPGEQQAALLERLLDQPEVEHLEVAEAAVHELRRPAAGAAGEVALLDEGRGESAGDGVQRRTGTHDARADHQNVEVRGPVLTGGRHRVEGLGAGAGSEVGGQAHAASLSGSCDPAVSSAQAEGADPGSRGEAVQHETDGRQQREQPEDDARARRRATAAPRSPTAARRAAARPASPRARSARPQDRPVGCRSSSAAAR